MTPDQSAVSRLLEQAQQARKAGNKRLARQYAEQAARLAPDNEEVWMMMAALASPRASVVYMEKALQINPQSERVRQGMHWAAERLRNEPPRAPVAVVPVQPKPATRFRFSYVGVVLAVLCLVAVAAVINNVTPAAAFINNSLFSAKQSTPAWAPVDVAKPTYTLAVVPTSTATLESFPTSGSTDASTDSGTTLPTDNLLPSDTPLPTDASTDAAMLVPSNTPLQTAVIVPSDTATPAPTDTPAATSLPAAATPTALPTDDSNYASPTPLPTDTPGPALPVSPTRALVTPPPLQTNLGGGPGTRWIDVDLTHQMTYAYEGNTVVNSFVVSTGTWQYPTVTGQYHIYVKYAFKDMSGPGYFLPNVPWTMFFYQGYALHGTYWHHNFGTPMSHGCVNLSIPDAAWLFSWASVGTLVNVHY